MTRLVCNNIGFQGCTAFFMTFICTDCSDFAFRVLSAYGFEYKPRRFESFRLFITVILSYMYTWFYLFGDVDSNFSHQPSIKNLS